MIPPLKSEPEAEWLIEPMANPFPNKWPGRWFQFRKVGTTEYGNAHESTLHLYVGEKEAQRAMK